MIVYTYEFFYLISIISRKDLFGKTVGRQETTSELTDERSSPCLGEKILKETGDGT